MLVQNMFKKDRGCDPWLLRSKKARIVMESLYEHFRHEYAHRECGDNVVTISYADELAGIIRVIYRMVLAAIEDVRAQRLSLNQATIDGYLEIGTPRNGQNYYTLQHGLALAVMNVDLINDDEVYQQAFLEGDVSYERVHELRFNEPLHVDAAVQVDDEESSANSEQSHMTGATSMIDDGLSEVNGANLQLIDFSEESVCTVDDGNAYLDDLEEQLSDDKLGVHRYGKGNIVVVNNDEYYDKLVNYKAPLIEPVNTLDPDGSKYEGIELYEPADGHIPVPEGSSMYISFHQFNNLLTSIDGKPTYTVGEHDYVLYFNPDISTIRKTHGVNYTRYLDQLTLFRRNDLNPRDISGYPKILSFSDIVHKLKLINKGIDTVSECGILKRAASDPNLNKFVSFEDTLDIHTFTPSSSEDDSCSKIDSDKTGTLNEYYSPISDKFDENEWCDFDEYGQENSSEVSERGPSQEGILKKIQSENNGMNAYYDSWDLGSGASMGKDAEEVID